MLSILKLVRIYLEEWCLSKQSVICDNTLTTLGQPWLLIRLTVDRVRHTTTLLPKLELSSEICGTDVNCSNYFINVPDDSRLSKSSWLLHVRVLSRHGTCAISRSNLSEQHRTCIQRIVHIQQTVYYMRCLTLENILYALIFYALGNQFSSKHLFSRTVQLRITHNSLVIFWVSPSLPLYADIPDLGF